MTAAGVELLAELLADVDPATFPDLSRIDHGTARVWDWPALTRALGLNMWEVWQVYPDWQRGGSVFKGTHDEAKAWVQQQPPTQQDGRPNAFTIERAR